MRLRDVDELIREFEKLKTDGNTEYTEGINTGINRCIVLAFNSSIVDAEPVRHGRWGKTWQSFVSPNKFRNYFCSECGLELDEHIRSKPNYCPNCGAKMD